MAVEIENRTRGDFLLEDNREELPPVSACYTSEPCLLASLSRSTTTINERRGASVARSVTHWSGRFLGSEPTGRVGWLDAAGCWFRDAEFVLVAAVEPFTLYRATNITHVKNALSEFGAIIETIS